MKRLAAIAILGTLAGASFAQVNNWEFGNPTNIAVRGGIFLPLISDTRDILGNSAMGLGFDYFLPRAIIPGANGESSISVDWLAKNTMGKDVNMFPIMVNQRWYNNQGYEGLGDQRTYFFAGIGMAIISGNGSSKNVLAGRAGIGIEMSEHLFGEAAFLMSSEKNNLAATGLGVWIGYRF